jgi:regulator of protease activity HflC (stomatin/prohibitin superfamily)
MAMLNELDDEEERKCFNIENFESLVSPITQQNIAEDDRTFESNSLLKKTLQISLNEKVSDCGIEILDVIVLGVGFPSQVITKLTQHHVAMSLEKERQAQNKKEVVLFKQNEEINTLQQTFEEEKEEILQEGELSQLMESMEKRFEQSETDQSILKIRATAEFNIESINAESEYTVQKIIDIAKLEASKIKHDSVAEAELAKSDARGEVSIIEANAAMEGAYFESAGEKGNYNIACALLFDA